MTPILKGQLGAIPSCIVNAYHYKSLGDLQLSVGSVLGVRRSILSIDGGGMRGLFSLEILKDICTECYGDSATISTTKFISHFDLIAGTSTGALIAVGLANGHSIDDIIQHYITLGANVFNNTWTAWPKHGYKMVTTGGFYDETILVNEMRKLFGKTKLNELDKQVMVVSTDKTTSVFTPYIFRSYVIDSITKNDQPITSPLEGRAPGILYYGEGVDNDVEIVDCLRASTAAPSYFSPTRYGATDLIDGGIVANNPTELAIFEAASRWPKDSIGTILSIGNGTVKGTSGYSSLFGLFKDTLNLITNAEETNRRIKEWISANKWDINYFRFSPSDLGAIKLDECDPTILRKGMAATSQYMANRRDDMRKLVGIMKGDV